MESRLAPSSYLLIGGVSSPETEGCFKLASSSAIVLQVVSYLTVIVR
jgi:hypothetical protein